MQANAVEEAQEAEDFKDACERGLVLLRRIHELEDEVALRSRNISFGYVRGRGLPKPETGSIAPKPRVPAIDIPPVAAQMGD